MIALAARWSEGRSMLGWLIPASVALHLAAVALMPSARMVGAALPPLVIEVAEAPPTPEKPRDQPEPAPAAVTPRAAAPVRAAGAARATTADNVPVATTPSSEAPVDFTGTVFSNDGAGVATGGPARQQVSPVASVTPPARRPEPAMPRVVEPSSLARRPRAPGLDAELERHYPVEARRSGISGTAVLRVRILPDGRIGEVHVVSESWSGFGPACERTVRAARWEPPIDRDGAPVATEITYACRFEVRS